MAVSVSTYCTCRIRPSYCTFWNYVLWPNVWRTQAMVYELVFLCFNHQSPTQQQQQQIRPQQIVWIKWNKIPLPLSIPNLSCFQRVALYTIMSLNTHFSMLSEMKSWWMNAKTFSAEYPAVHWFCPHVHVYLILIDTFRWAWNYFMNPH